MTNTLSVYRSLQTLALIRKFCTPQTAAVIACHDRDLIELPPMRRLHLADGRVNLEGVNATR